MKENHLLFIGLLTMIFAVAVPAGAAAAEFPVITFQAEGQEGGPLLQNAGEDFWAELRIVETDYGEPEPLHLN